MLRKVDKPLTVILSPSSHGEATNVLDLLATARASGLNDFTIITPRILDDEFEMVSALAGIEAEKCAEWICCHTEESAYSLNWIFCCMSCRVLRTSAIKS